MKQRTRPTGPRGRADAPADRGHAVVVGGDLSGVCAAHALSRSFARVTLTDARGPGGRAVSAGASIHLSARARVELEWLMPGFRALLREAGAGRMEPIGRRSDAAASVPYAVACPEDVLFRTCARILCARPNVRLLHRARAVRLRMSADRFARACGVDVSLESADPAGGRQLVEIDADVVVDASGPASPLALGVIGIDPANASDNDRLDFPRGGSATRQRFGPTHAPPEGYLPIGDTVLAGPEGLDLRATVAALSARALEEALAVGSTRDPGFAARFVEGQARRHRDVWRRLELEATHREPHALPPSLLEARRRYWRACRRGARADAGLASVVARVDQVLDPPAKLLDPRIVWRVLTGPQATRAMARSSLARGHDSPGS